VSDTDDLGVGGLRATGHRARPRRGRGCLPVLVALVIIAVLAVLAYVKGVDYIKERLSGPPDYSGDGHGAVVVTLEKGTLTQIGETLEQADVVKSVNAFTDATENEPRSAGIQPGSYKLHLQMSGASALKLLLDPSAKVKNPTVTIPEGLRAKEILAVIADKTDFTPKQLQTAYNDTAALGLPSYAKGNPEGYLFPSTYDIKDDTTAASLLHDMVAKFVQEADSLDLEAKAHQVGYSPTDVVTVASLVQAESGAADMSKVASVVYNRLDQGMPLQFDSTLHYALNLRGDVTLTDEQRRTETPYNTYTQTGLTPTPIDAPGEAALEAALNPAKTDYLYFVTVNLATGKTKFASTLAEHNQNVEEYRQYCETSDEC
jgi:UPF0755 protein